MKALKHLLLAGLFAAGLAAGATPAGAQEQLRHAAAEVAGVRLHYVTAGPVSGEPVVLLHGFPQTWASWRAVIAELSRSHRVIAPDLRGLGDSARPEGGYDFATVAGDVAALMRSLGHERYAVVGQDLGAPVAYALAAQNRRSVTKLAFMESVLPGFGWEWGMDHREDVRVWHFSFFAVPDLPEALASGREPLLIEHFVRELAVDADRATAQLPEYVRAYSAPGAMRAAFAYYRAFPENNRRFKELARSKLNIPVLAVGGEGSLGPLVEKEMRNVATDVTGWVVPGSGHWVQEEAPKAVAERLRAFLKHTTLKPRGG
jgi:pimeloyl-ACP methyl ester carboxylesterase